MAGSLAVGAMLVAGAIVLAMESGGPASRTSIEIVIRHSKFEPSEITVPVGVPVRVTLVNKDPIDHEWIVGDETIHAVHRTGTELLHPDLPTEVFLLAGESRTTTITFESRGSLRFICHLPAHEAYGMVGSVIIR